MSLIEELVGRVTALEEQVTQLRAEHAGTKLDDVSQMIRSLRFESDEHRMATVGLRHEIIGLRGDVDRRMGALENKLNTIIEMLNRLQG